jgi:hypothetical protein
MEDGVWSIVESFLGLSDCRHGYVRFYFLFRWLQ